MPQPTLIIIAGCNGSGKSTFSKFHNEKITPFDYDKRYLEIYNSLQDSEFRDTFAKNKTTEEFESSITGAFLNGQDFCYETNFDSHPIYWANQAKELGYNIELYFYCLKNLDLAKKRVAIRTANKGHFINDSIIFHKWKEGYKNLDLHFNIFDYVLLLDNSIHLKPPKHLFAIIKNEDNVFEVEKYEEQLPVYSKKRFPLICGIVLNNK